ncbi:MAG: hypothetical protein UHD09_09240 [Bifidobacterium sp.]|nr:hypothetical protein [Bifidobacterium sp.]
MSHPDTGHTDPGPGPCASMEELDDHHGFIRVGDTGQPGAACELQRRLDCLETSERFHVRRFTRFNQYPTNEDGFPAVMRLMDGSRGRIRDVTDEIGLRHGTVFDLEPMRAAEPDNTHMMTGLLIHYQPDLWAMMAPDWDASSVCLCLFAHQLRAHGLLTDVAFKAQPGVLAVELERAGVVLPVPSDSMVNWETYGDHLGLYVYDSVALERSMRRYPRYYDPTATPRPGDVERDITASLDRLEQLRDRLAATAGADAQRPGHGTKEDPC